MGFWSVAIVLALASVLAMLLPLWRRPAPTGKPVNPSLAVYRDQLRELDRDRDAGRLDARDHAAARLEIERRMLAEDGGEADAGEIGSVEARRVRRFTAAGLIVIALPLATFATYLVVGRPGVPDLPLAERTAELAQAKEENDRQRQVLGMVERLAKRLEDQPDDPEGWSRLGRSYLVLRRFKEAADAYGRALGLVPGNANLLSNYGEALYFADDQRMSERARQAFEQALARQPKHPQARFYAAIGIYQAGDAETALKLWAELVSDSPPDAPWLAMVNSQMAKVAELSGLPMPSIARRAPPLARPGPSQADVAAAGQMSEADRSEMIAGMVARLAERLESEPDDLEGWRRLARSYGVLGRHEEALAAHARAAALAPDNPEVLLDHARALFPPSNQIDTMPPAFKSTVARLRQLAPDNPEVIFFSGMVALADGDRKSARDLWQSLLERLPPGSEPHTMLSERIDRLD